MNPKKKRNVCICGKEVSTVRGVFCSSTCRSRSLYTVYIDMWKQGLRPGYVEKSLRIHTYVRSYLGQKYNWSCQDCGFNQINPFTKKTPLEIHHIDGNALNCAQDNLKLLCPNCHALTPNFKSRNKGSKRKHR